MTTEHFDVIVIGTGGAGSSALFHAARRGAKVLGLDRFPPAHDRGSSHGQTRLIRQAYFEHPDYVPLLLRAYELWETLQSEFGDFDTGPTVVAAPAAEDTWKEDTWKIAIWEGTSVRVDVVNLHSDIPIPANANETAPVVPVQRSFHVPVTPDGHGPGGQEGLDGLKDASDLWSLFGD